MLLELPPLSQVPGADCVVKATRPELGAIMRDVNAAGHHLCGLGIACKSQKMKGLDNGSVLNIEDIQEYAVHKRKYLKRPT